MQDLAEKSFDQIAEQTRQTWQAYLSRIRITGGTDDQQEIFYSNLYHSLIKPVDCTDESPFWEEDGPFYFDFATMWDMYKTQLPLILTECLPGVF